MEVLATIVDDIRGPRGDAPGAIEIRSLYGEVRGLACRCPCGCGEELWLPTRPAGSPDKGSHPRWEYDGDRERPTIHPSVHNTGLPCQWHGWLKAGVWTSC